MKTKIEINGTEYLVEVDESGNEANFWKFDGIVYTHEGRAVGVGGLIILSLIKKLRSINDY